MTDLTNTETRARKAAPGRGEYMVYFAIIFVLAIPVQALLALLSLAGLVREPLGNPLTGAWEQAQITTPKIFWG